MPMNTRTNIILDDKLVAQAMKQAGVTTKKAAVEAALKAFVMKRRKIDYDSLLALEGSRLVADGYDPKEPFGQRTGLPAHAVAQKRAPYKVQAEVLRKPVARSKSQP